MHAALIFDLDGTLWDSSRACTDGWNRALHQLGQKAVTPDQLSAVMGLPHDRIFERVFPELSPETREGVGDACFREELAAIKEAQVPVYPGVAEGLKRLAETYPLYLVSNCLTGYLDTFFQETHLKGLFRGWLCYGMTGRSKGQNLAQLLREQKLRDAAYIGDTAGDQSAATQAGLTYYHVNYGFGHPDKECLSFDSFAELVAFFL